MTKSEFLNILADGLKDFPQKELSDILFDYQEHFTNGFQNGKTEEDIIEELGSPYDIVHQYRSSYIEKVKSIPFEEEVIDSNINDVNYENVDSTEDYSFSDDFEIDEDFEVKGNTNNSQSENSNKNNFTKNMKNNINNAFDKASKMSVPRLIIGILIAVFLAPIAFGLGTAAIMLPLSLLGASVGLFISIFGVAFADSILNIIGFTFIPPFISDFPISSIVFFLIGLTLIFILLTMISYYCSKAIFIFIKNLYLKLIKGGTSNE